MKIIRLLIMFFLIYCVANYLYPLNLNILMVSNQPYDSTQTYRSFRICVESENSAVQDLKEAIERVRGIPWRNQRIYKDFGKIYESEILNSKLLQDYDIREGHTLALRTIERKY